MTAALSSVDEGRPARIVAAAEGWIGTPWAHQASCRGAGSDCLGLVRGVWREIVGREPEPLPAYAPDWGEATGEERLLAGARRWFVEIAPCEARPGDVLLLRMRVGGPAGHLAVLAGVEPLPRMIHAWSGRGVVASTVGPWWRRRIAAAFRFPE